MTILMTLAITVAAVLIETLTKKSPKNRSEG